MGFHEARPRSVFSARSDKEGYYQRRKRANAENDGGVSRADRPDRKRQARLLEPMRTGVLA